MTVKNSGRADSELVINEQDLSRRKRQGFLQEKLPDFELSSQQQFLNMLPAFMQDLVAKLPVTLLEMSEEELTDRLFGEEDPPQVHEMLRQAIWDEYDRCQRYKINMLDIGRVIQGVCTIGFFVNRFCQEPENIAWLITPPIDYTKGIREILQMGLSQFREIMKLPNATKDGSPNTKLIDVKFKIVQHIDMRLKGAIVQRIDQRNINVNYQGDPEDAPAAAARPVGELSMGEVDAKLKELEKRSLALSAPARVEVDLMKPPAVMLDADEEIKVFKEKEAQRDTPGDCELSVGISADD